jgi:hypothetical protein
MVAYPQISFYVMGSFNENEHYKILTNPHSLSKNYQLVFKGWFECQMELSTPEAN